MTARTVTLVAWAVVLAAVAVGLILFADLAGVTR